MKTYTHSSIQDARQYAEQKDSPKLNNILIFLLNEREATYQSVLKKWNKADRLCKYMSNFEHINNSYQSVPSWFKNVYIYNRTEDYLSNKYFDEVIEHYYKISGYSVSKTFVLKDPGIIEKTQKPRYSEIEYDGEEIRDIREMSIRETCSIDKYKLQKDKCYKYLSGKDGQAESDIDEARALIWDSIFRDGTVKIFFGIGSLRRQKII